MWVLVSLKLHMPWVVIKRKKDRLCVWLYKLRLNLKGHGYHILQFKSDSVCGPFLLVVAIIFSCYLEKAMASYILFPLR